MGMGLLESILEGIVGKLHFYIFLGKKVVAEVIIEKKDIVIDIINPFMAVNTVIKELLSKKEKDIDSETLKKLKKMGYRIIIRYKNSEIVL